MSVEIARRGERLHLRHGPTDLVILCDAPAREAAFASAINAMDGLLAALVEDLPRLRAFDGPPPSGPVARAMWRAVEGWRPTPVTPMAAVAGAIADHVLAAMIAAGAARAAVNNGGDIALHLAPGQSMTLAIAGLDGAVPGRIRLTGADGIGGVATSGRGGRSLTRGIADSVTVLARTAAEADAAATLIANAVDLPDHPAITRAPARVVDPDSDLGDLTVVTHVGPLTSADRRAALDRGRAEAARALSLGLIRGAALRLGDEMTLVGQTERLIESPAHA